MKKIVISLVALGIVFTGCVKQNEYLSAPPQAIETKECTTQNPVNAPKEEHLLTKRAPLRIIVIGQGVAPCTSTCSPEQALVLAKRAAIVDGYRLIAEKVKGVYVQGNDYVHNMMIKSSKVRTYVDANIRNANVVDTMYKDGLCEVEMEITLNYSQFAY